MFYGTLAFAVIYLALGISCLAIQDYPLNQIRAKLLANQDTNGITDIDSALKSWKYILDGIGSLSLIASIISLSLSSSSFHISRRLEQYHMAN